MNRTCIILIMAGLTACALLTTRAAAHPASAIAVDERGRVYFTHAEKGVFRLDDGGKLTPISPSAMHWMAIDRSGAFAGSAEEFGEWFGRVTPKGEKPALISCSDFPCVVGKDGNLFFAKMHGLNIVRRTPEGKESVLASREKFGIDDKRPVGVNGIASGPDGAIYLVTLENVKGYEGSGEHVVYAVAMDGSIRTLAKNFVTEKLPEGQRHPEVRPEYCRGMAVDEKGNVYVAATGNRCVMKLTAKGQASVLLKTDKPWTPTGVDVFNGEVFVLEHDDETPTEGRKWPLRVRRVDRDGVVTVLTALKGDGTEAPTPKNP